MKSLDKYFQDLMYRQRSMELLNAENLAAKLNCTKKQMLNAQVGKPIPDKVYSVLINWLEN